jgi:pimeloyl-ACP methyl ester carboxylesterase
MVFAASKPAWTAAIIAAAIACIAGCACPLSCLMVSAPNRFSLLAGTCNPLPPMESWVADRHFWVRVGPPEARLSVSVIEPDGGAPRGTVLVLHGIYVRSITMLPQARSLARAGYRAVLVDLRGHGRSTGKYLTYGVREAQDLSQVIDAMQAQGLIAGPIGVWGISYGATTAIHLAACDPRVRAVVAVEPFGMLRPEVRHFGRLLMPEATCFLSDAQFDQIVDKAAAKAGFDPDGADAVDAIAETSAPVLLMHGTDDWIVPYWNSVALQQAAPAGSERIPIFGGGHASLWFDRNRHVSSNAIQWFDRWLSDCGWVE